MMGASTMLASCIGAVFVGMALATASDAADKHSKNVEVKDLTFRTWFKAGAAEEGLSMGVPAAKTRWTKDGNLSVEVC